MVTYKINNRMKMCFPHMSAKTVFIDSNGDSMS